MRSDRYTKQVLTVIAVALVAMAARAWLDAGPWLAATEAQAQTRPAEYDISIPKAWGKVVFYGSGNFVFEDQEGILREVDVRGRAPEYPKVKSLVRRGE